MSLSSRSSKLTLAKAKVLRGNVYRGLSDKLLVTVLQGIWHFGAHFKGWVQDAFKAGIAIPHIFVGCC